MNRWDIIDRDRFDPLPLLALFVHCGWVMKKYVPSGLMAESMVAFLWFTLKTITHIFLLQTNVFLEYELRFTCHPYNNLVSSTST